MVKSCWKIFPCQHGLFLETFVESRRGKEVSRCLIFTFEPVHNVLVGVSTLVEECVVSNLWIDKLGTGKGQTGRKFILERWLRVFWGWNLSLNVFESDGKLPKAHIHFLKRGASNGWDGILIRNRLREMLEGMDYWLLDRVFPFVAVLINLSTEYEKTAPMSTVQMRYCETVSDVTDDMWQRTWR